MQTTFKGRNVEIAEVSSASDVVDCFIESAYYVDSGEELDDTELEQLTNENPELVYEMWFDNKLGAADLLMDSMRDDY